MAEVRGRPGEDPAASDDRLMARAADGDRDAYAILVDRHLGRTVTLARRVLNSAADADDVAQEAMLRLWHMAPNWRAGEARVSTWLYRVTVNLCLDHKRRPVQDALEAAGEIADPADGADRLVEMSETQRLVQTAVGELPERQRAALALCHFAGLSNAEAAAALSVSVGALEGLLVRARRTLKVRLADLAAAVSGE